jgi:acyl transferase domain-containing protein
VLLLPGIGDHYVGMAEGLYLACEGFREEVDRCAGILKPLLGVDIRQVIYPASQSWKQTTEAKGIDLKRMLGHSADEPPDADTIRLGTTLFSQPALFTIEYAMARQWASLGVTPSAIIGHSMGEYVAACLAGVLSLEDALRLIAVRAKLVNELPQAVMLAVMLPEEELLSQLPADLSVSLINGPSHCVIAGPPDSVEAFERTLSERGVIARRVQNGHAFHSRLMEPVVRAFEEEVRKVRLNAPQIPYISNVSGSWITAAQATDPTYWVRHLTRTARFSAALHALWQLPQPVLIECGPGRTLTILANQHPERKGPLRGAISSIRQRYENESDLQVLLGAVGRAWLAGTAEYHLCIASKLLLERRARSVRRPCATCGASGCATGQRGRDHLLRGRCSHERAREGAPRDLEQGAGARRHRSR